MITNRHRLGLALAAAAVALAAAAPAQAQRTKREESRDRSSRGPKLTEGVRAALAEAQKAIAAQDFATATTQIRAAEGGSRGCR